MRALLPVPDGDVDLADVYAYPLGAPWLRANMVASVDGAAVVDGSSRALSSPADRRLLGLLRTLSDAVVVGAGTARAERYGPVPATPARVQWRRARGLPVVPRLVVVTRSLELDPSLPFLAPVPGQPPALVVTPEAAAGERGERYRGVTELVATPGRDIDLRAAVAALHARGLTRLLCEGGPTLLGSLAADGLLDELCLTVSPRLVSGGATRVVAGPVLAVPQQARLAGLLEEEGFLFARYVRESG